MTAPGRRRPALVGLETHSIQQEIMSKRLFIYLTEHDLPIGKPLPWSVYVRSGELLAPAGFIVPDGSARSRLLLTRPVRVALGDEQNSPLAVSELDPEDYASTKKARETPDPIKYLKHNAEGMMLTFKLPGDFEPRTVPVEFYGRIPLQSVIVSAPLLPVGLTWQNFEGTPVSAQVIFGRNLCIFNTTIMRFSGLPSGHLFLRYPQEAVTKPFRAALRIDAKIPASISTAEGHAVPAVIADISGTGCAIDTGFILGKAGTRLNVAFRIKIHDKAHVLRVPCIIKSIKGKLSQQLRYGLQFDDSADDATLLVLKSFVYEHLAER